MLTEQTKDKTNLNGLSYAEVVESRNKYGENVLTPPKRTPLWKLYLEKYRDPIIQILLVAAAISLALAFVENEFMETIGIFLAIFFATTIGFYFERDAAKKFNVLNALGEEQAVKVKRAGKVVEIPRREVVVGDIMLIEVGDEIPADGTLLQSTDLQVDESSLTGEPIANKFAEQNNEDNEATYPVNMVLRSTMVMNGRGMARVITTGDNTEIGKVARKSSEMTATKTPLNMQLDKLAKLISKIGFSVAISAFVIFLSHDIITNPIWHTAEYMKMAEIVLGYFMMSVTLIVMAVPEGLPMAVTLSLALNMRRMLKSNNLVRKLHACETMGAVTVICTDKTGTLTQNRMTVASLDRYDDSFDGEDASKALLMNAISLNTTAELSEEGGIGNPTEAALLLWMRDKGTDYKAIRESIATEQQLPFSTERKYMATTAVVNGRKYLFAKGAPEIIMNMCDIAEDERKNVETKLLGYQQKAMRTLAFAFREFDENATINLEQPSSLTLHAVAAISDPIRDDVPDAVKECRDAGIGVKIVTGDTSATAIEIGRQIGIWEDNEQKENATDKELWHITGPDFAALSDDEAYERVVLLRVMSRARPSDKQRLVELLQKHGEVVAVTGDGTNDAPALNYAHVGLSLGSGTSVAKEASDMTLIDDSFGSIARAVMWGRSLYRNIQRFLFFQLVVNLTALLLVLGGSILGTQIPLTVTQILWVNLIMDTFAAMALASLPPSREVMKEKPRKQTDFIINKGMARGIIFCGLAFFALMFAFLIHCEYNCDNGVKLHEQTLFFTTFVMLQFWNLLNAKTLGSEHSALHNIMSDKALLFVLVFIVAGQWMIVTFGGKMFRVEPLSLVEWGIIIASTSVVLWFGEAWRAIMRIRNNR